MRTKWTRGAHPIGKLTLLATSTALTAMAAPNVGPVDVAPKSILLGVGTTITVTAVITDTTLLDGGASLQRIDSSGRVLATYGVLHDDGRNGDATSNDRIFSVQQFLTEATPGPIQLRVSAGFRGVLTRVFSGVMTVNVTGAAAPRIVIESPQNLSYLSTPSVTVTGTVTDLTATVTVNELNAPVSNGRFTINLPLAEGPNIIAATARTPTGATSSSITVNLDTTPPRVTITSPVDQFVTTDASVSVAGNVNDIVVGTVNNHQVQVTVNGAAAQVANRTFLAANIPLAMGNNAIRAVGVDRAGNSFNTQITVRREAPTQPQIRLLSGNNQTGVIGSLLPAPLVVALVDAAGSPIPNRPVIFKVTQNNGQVAGAGPAAISTIVNTNAQGQAQVRWTLGARSGAGSNCVEAYSVGYGGTAVFTATGTVGTAGKIVIDSGNSQVGEVNKPLPKPLIAVVVDQGNNRWPNVPVTFIVKSGGGSFAGQASFTMNTDSDGRAAATPTLGFQEGNENNLFEANFPLNQGYPASFTASGRAAGNPDATRISGVVLDNSNVPIPGVTIRAVRSNLLTQNSAVIANALTVRTDAQGQFSVQPAPVGFVKLLVDGSTAQRPGKYPNLDYDLVTIAGQNNGVGMPIYLLPINTANQLCVTATTGGGTLTIPEAPGFSLTFGPGQVTFPGNTKEGCVSATVVHPDKVPMVPGFGQQPRFIVTIQPAGAMFNPPSPITTPNVDGLRPGEVTEMYSFDHDIGAFTSIGTGFVSMDGLTIAAKAGVGVLKAGWHCGGNPTSNGTAGTCPECQTCGPSKCDPTPTAQLTPWKTTPVIIPANATCSAVGAAVLTRFDSFCWENTDTVFVKGGACHCTWDLRFDLVDERCNIPTDETAAFCDGTGFRTTKSRATNIPLSPRYKLPALGKGFTTGAVINDVCHCMPPRVNTGPFQIDVDVQFCR